VACYDPDSVSFLNGYEPMANGHAVCTPTQVTGFIDECLTQGGDCAGYETDNPDCYGCALAGYATGNVDFEGYYPLFVTPEGADWQYVNNAACDCAVADRLDCSVPISNYILCYYSACALCPLTGNDLDDCLAVLDTATITECEQIVIPAGCDTVPAAAECEGASFVASASAVLNTMCGAL
jgi:hypothetical protein